MSFHPQQASGGLLDIERAYHRFLAASCRKLYIHTIVHVHIHVNLVDAICTISEHHYIFTSAHSPSCIDRLIYCFTVHITRQYHIV